MARIGDDRAFSDDAAVDRSSTRGTRTAARAPRPRRGKLTEPGFESVLAAAPRPPVPEVAVAPPASSPAAPARPPSLPVTTSVLPRDGSIVEAVVAWLVVETPVPQGAASVATTTEAATATTPTTPTTAASDAMLACEAPPTAVVDEAPALEARRRGPGDEGVGSAVKRAADEGAAAPAPAPAPAAALPALAVLELAPVVAPVAAPPPIAIVEASSAGAAATLAAGRDPELDEVERADEPAPVGSIGRTSARVSIGEGPDRLALTISAAGHLIRITAVSESTHLTTELRRGADELAASLSRHGLELGTLTTGGGSDHRSEPDEPAPPGGRREPTPTDHTPARTGVRVVA